MADGRDVKRRASAEVLRYRHRAIAPEHLFLALAGDGVGAVGRWFAGLDVPAPRIRAEIERHAPPPVTKEEMCPG